MRKFLIVFLLPVVISAQITTTEVPKPAEIPSDYDLGNEWIYDFDGDGSKDVINAYGKVGASPRFYFAVYSYLKKQIVVTFPMESYREIKFEDLNMNNGIEIIISDITYKTQIYSFSSSTPNKKKVH